MRVLGRVPLFAGLTVPELAAIDARMVSLSWAAGDVLFTAGAPADHLYVLASGRVKLFRPTSGGREIVVDLLSPGDLFGSLTALGDPTYPETAEALTTTCALQMDPAAFRAVLTERPPVALRVLDDVAARLARARSDLATTPRTPWRNASPPPCCAWRTSSVRTVPASAARCSRSRSRARTSPG